MTLVRKVSIENYKSVRKLTLELGRVNVLIGANGSGKSNILEAIAFGSAAARNKLDNEYLVPRGIRVTEPRFMRSAFPGSDVAGPVVVKLEAQGLKAQGEDRWHFVVDPDRRALVSPEQATWASNPTQVITKLVDQKIDELIAQEAPAGMLDQLKLGLKDKVDAIRADAVRVVLQAALPSDFLIYAPENSALRIFQSEPQILPLGVRGEGLFAHLKALGAADAEKLLTIGERLALLDWFERLEIPKDLAPGERSLLIRDRYMTEGALFDQRSANEGFLFLLFYLTLFISDATPSFFAVDNVDTSLNPKLVTTLVRQLVELASKHDKQVIFTTHNPAVLDGLDLRDDEQRLFVTERGKDGATRARRVKAPVPLDGDPEVALSEAFVRGYLGGLPKNF